MTSAGSDPEVAPPPPIDTAVAGLGDDERIGRYVRRVRRARGLTLTRLAALAELSQPFLSQLERGQAQPSMASLGKIARALGSSTLELIAGAESLGRRGLGEGPALVRADEGDQGSYGLGRARLLVHGRRPFQPMEFTGHNTELDAMHLHPEDEFLHVLEGRCRVDLVGEACHDLATGDSLYITGGTGHRWCSADGAPYRLLLVKQQVSVRFDGSAPTPEEAR